LGADSLGSDPPTQRFNGLNNTPEGLAILANGCQIPTTPTTTPATTTPATRVRPVPPVRPVLRPPWWDSRARRA